MIVCSCGRTPCRAGSSSTGPARGAGPRAHSRRSDPGTCRRAGVSGADAGPDRRGHPQAATRPARPRGRRSRAGCGGRAGGRTADKWTGVKRVGTNVGQDVGHHRHHRHPYTVPIRRVNILRVQCGHLTDGWSKPNNRAALGVRCPAGAWRPAAMSTAATLTTATTDDALD